MRFWERLKLLANFSAEAFGKTEAGRVMCTRWFLWWLCYVAVSRTNFYAMSFQRHDSLTARLGDRRNRPYWRLWVEDNSFDRLGRNNFTPGARFDVARRPGTGLVISESLMGSCRITPRKKGGVLSYEARDLSNFLGTPDVRVRISVGKIVVTPLLRFHSIARPATECWAIVGLSLITPTGIADIHTATPLNLAHTAASTEVDLDESNLIYATELIGNQRPGRVYLRGTPIMLTVAGQFLRASGYGETTNPGEFIR